jgi:hypothetical protein
MLMTLLLLGGDCGACVYGPREHGGDCGACVYGLLEEPGVVVWRLTRAQYGHIVPACTAQWCFSALRR